MRKLFGSIFALCLLLLAVANAANWHVDVGYGAGTPIPGTPVQWLVFRFFPENLTVVEGDTVTWTLRNDGHSVTFSPAILPLFKDTDNLFFDPALFPLPAATGTAANPTIISNATGIYSSGAMFQPGQSWTAQFTKAAPSLLYFCILHPDMIGSVTVLPAGSMAPTTQAQYDASTQAELAVVNTTAASLGSRIRTAPLIETRSDGTRNITIDNGYGDKATKFSLNVFGPSFFTANVGDTLTFILRDAMTGHTIAFNGSNEFYWNTIEVLTNGTLTTSKFFIRSFGDNTNWAGQFISGGLLLPAGTLGGLQQWSVTIGADLEKNYQLPRNFTFLCNIHTLPPGPDVPPGQRQYLGMSATVEIHPRGTTQGSGTATLMLSMLSLVAMLILTMF